jgi:hypothetical protein
MVASAVFGMGYVCGLPELHPVANESGLTSVGTHQKRLHVKT